MTEVEGEFKVLDEMCNKCSVHIRMWPDGVRFCPECHKVWWPEKNTLKDYTVKELLEHILSRPEEELKATGIDTTNIDDKTEEVETAMYHYAQEIYRLKFIPAKLGTHWSIIVWKKESE